MGFLTLETKELKKMEKRDWGGGKRRDTIISFYTKALVREHNRKYSKAPQRDILLQHFVALFISPSLLLKFNCMFVCVCVCRKKMHSCVCSFVFFFFLVH